MLNEPISKRYRADGRENFQLTPLQVAARNRIAAKLQKGEYLLEAVDCPLCGGRQSTSLSEKDTYGVPVKVVACCQCGLVYNNPRMARSSLPALYSDDYRELDRVLPDKNAYFQLESTKGKRIHQFLEKNDLLSRMNGKLVVDIGCGAGGVLGHFKQAGYEVLGCDLVPDHLEFGKCEQQLDLHYGGLETIRGIVVERNAEIGLIIYEQVFEHLPDPRSELQILHQMLGSDGLLFIGVPGLRNIDEQYDSDFLRFLQMPHLVHFDLDHLVAMMQTSGFEFIAGNEVVQAVFLKKDGPIKSSWPSLAATIDFLAGLEERRRKKARASLMKNLPAYFARGVRNGIEKSGLPEPVKQQIVGRLRCIKRLIKPGS